MTPTALPARIGYAVLAFPLGALLGFFAALSLLKIAGPLFHDNHPSMQGFGYFMMALASGAAMATNTSLVALTLPWKRPVKNDGTAIRISASALFLILAFLMLVGQGHALIFVLAVSSWLAVSIYFTFVRHGVFDEKVEPAPASVP